MTLPYEEKLAVNMARDFLERLLDPRKTPKVPRAIRRGAVHVLRHFPGGYQTDVLYEHAGVKKDEGRLP